MAYLQKKMGCNRKMGSYPNHVYRNPLDGRISLHFINQSGFFKHLKKGKPGKATE
jgi:hypothetical protein